MRRVATGQGAALAENYLCQKPEMFALGVKVHFPRGRDERMPVQDDDAFAVFFGVFSQPLGQFQFFGGKKLVAEPANLSEHSRVAENKRTGEQPAHPAGAVPSPDDDARRAVTGIYADGRAARETVAGDNLLGDVG